MKNTVVAILLLFVIAINMGFVPVCAGTNPAVTVQDASGTKGDILEVPVVMSDNTGFSNLGIEITYDTDALKLIGAVPGDTGAVFTGAPEYSVVPYNMSWDSASNVSFNGVLVTLLFEITAENTGEYTVSADYYKGRNRDYIDGINVNYDESYTPLGLSYVSGTVFVSAPTVRIGSVEAVFGQTVDVPVILENNKGFSNMAIEIGYDKNSLRLKNVVSFDTGATFTQAQSLEALPYNISWDSATDIQFNGNIAMITFEVLTQKTGNYEITVSYYKGRNGDYIDGKSVNYNDNFEPIGLKYAHGIISVTKPCITLKGVAGDFGIAEIALTGDLSCGKIYVASYGDEGLLAIKEYNPQNEMEVEIEEKGNFVKVMWWNSNLSPVCSALEISKNR